jgi:hypothetical protein
MKRNVAIGHYGGASLLLHLCTITGMEHRIMAERFRFRFELDAISDIQPWGEPGKASLHWFGLTSGRYWIETPRGEVLRYTPEIRKLWNFPFVYVDYQVARLFEDVQEHLPAELEPVPEDIATLASDPAWLERLARWIDEECSKEEGRRRWDLYEAAMSWWWQRDLDTAYLSHGPRISIWRVDDEVHFRWTTTENEDRGVPVFVKPTGEFTMRWTTFQSAAIGFCDEEVLSAMRGRIADLRNAGWNRTDCAVDLNGLVADQEQREEIFAQLGNQIPETNWAEVRAQLRDLKSRVASI